MKRTNVCIFGFLLTLVVLMAVMFACSPPPDNTSDVVPVAPKGDPIKIGVCMPSSGPLAGLARLQTDGIKAAFQMAGNSGGRPVELVYREPGNSVREFDKVLNGLTENDKVSAIIACISDETPVSGQDNPHDRTIPLVVTSPCGPGRKKQGDEPVMRFCTTLEDQAQACARFITNNLRARRIGMILDVDDVTCVRLASLFSSNVVKQGGSIMNVAYVKRNQDPSSELTHLMGEKPDAIYVPFSPETSAALIMKARTIDREKTIIMSNVQPEETFLSGVGRSLEGVYILVDYHEQAVMSSRGRQFIEFFRKNMKNRGYLGSSLAMGADAYFLTVDMVLGAPNDGGPGVTAQGGYWNASMLGLVGATPSGAMRRQLFVGRIQKGFMRGATLKFIGQVEVSALNTGTDVRIQ